jgi:hypothetical protein
MQQLIVAGYSFSPADDEHLRSLFPQQVMNTNLRLILVNRCVDQEEYVTRAKAYFPGVIPKDGLFDDFRDFCHKFETH